MLPALEQSRDCPRLSDVILEDTGKYKAAPNHEKSFDIISEIVLNISNDIPNKRAISASKWLL